MSDPDISYYQRRVRVELAMAQATSGPAARSHYDLAGHYLDRLGSSTGEVKATRRELLRIRTGS